MTDLNYANHSYWIKNGRSENKSSRIHIRVPFCDTHVVVPSISAETYSHSSAALRIAV